MQNMQIIDDRHIQTAFGILGEVTKYDVYDTGQLKSIMVDGKNIVMTHAGELVPAYNETPRRKYKPSVEFYKSGMIKAVALDERQELETPIGELPAELVTFYETGEIKRVFPLDGKLSGFWSEEDEKALNIPLNFDLGFSRFCANIGGICFYKNGAIRSITLFPGETISVETLYGQIFVRTGVSLFEDGALQSCEPALPTMIVSPIGKITVFDHNAVGVTADSNSLNFNERGKVASLISGYNKIGVQTADEALLWYSPKIIPPPCEDEDETVSGLKISFTSDGVSFNNEGRMFSYKDSGFTVLPFLNGMPTCSPTDCANCSLCNG